MIYKIIFLISIITLAEISIINLSNNLNLVPNNLIVYDDETIEI